MWPRIWDPAEDLNKYCKTNIADNYGAPPEAHKLDPTGYENGSIGLCARCATG